MTDIERILLNQKNHTSALTIMAGIISNILVREHHMWTQANDPRSGFVDTDLTIITQLESQLKEMKIRNQ